MQIRSRHRMSENIPSLSDENFDSTVASSKELLLVDFWAPWCAPCRMVAPVLEDLAAEYAGRLRIAKLNVDDNPRTAVCFRVSSIPTLILFHNGEAVDLIIGAQPRASIQAVLDKHLA